MGERKTLESSAWTVSFLLSIYFNHLHLFVWTVA